MKKSDALKQKRHAANELQLALINRAKAANVDFTDAENVEFDTRTAEMASLDIEIARAMEMEAVELRAAVATAVPVTAGPSSEQREMGKMQERFSIAKALRESTPGGKGLSGLEKEIHEMGLAENRSADVKTPENTVFSMPIAMTRATSQTVTEDAAAFGGALVQNQAPRIVEPLRPRLVFEDLGATFLTGLSGGNIPLVVGNDFALTFLAETATITPQKKTFAGPTLSPKRAGGAVDISNQLLMQSSVGVDGMIMDGLKNGFGQLLHSSCINGVGGVSILGLLNLAGINVSALAAAGAATWASVVELQGLIEEDNATDESLGYLLNPKLKAALKQVKKDAGSGRFLYEEGMIDGVKAISSSLVPVLDAAGTPVYPLIYGDFKQMTIGQWGSLNIAIDPYSALLSNSVRLVLNTYADMAVANPKAFAKNALLTA